MRAAHVERARYHADLARRRYLAVDPANRLVADSLEADWNTALRDLADAQDDLRQGPPSSTPGNSPTPNAPGSHQLVTDLPAIWNDPATPARERKRIARLLLTDVTVHRDGDTITAHVRFPAGQHTHPHPARPQNRCRATQNTDHRSIAAIDELLDQHTSGEIADILNQRGLTTGTGQPFHGKLVDHIIHTYRLRSRRQRLRDTGMLTPAEMADLLAVSTQTVKHWHHAGLVSGLRYNDKGETLYHPPDPDHPPQRPTIGRPPKRRRPARTTNTDHINPMRCSMQPEVCRCGDETLAGSVPTPTCWL